MLILLPVLESLLLLVHSPFQSFVNHFFFLLRRQMTIFCSRRLIGQIRHQIFFNGFNVLSYLFFAKTDSCMALMLVTTMRYRIKPLSLIPNSFRNVDSFWSAIPRGNLMFQLESPCQLRCWGVSMRNIG